MELVVPTSLYLVATRADFAGTRDGEIGSENLINDKLLGTITYGRPLKSRIRGI